ncbi:conserved hypothetical protein [Leishmania major strain Friedlin]|uniref:Uncharacterized protein n=1 Tax=Leishmania major TaxID=5664 RepID=Q4QBC7_LEIMA|nr:conserved hypothetical protein [Leishmania major strain Friedlin]CAG9574166.1 hypothetical_protein_-_conserved [Leishmania major strain Friedlin]CAJ04145.1 conserved hypothetical protein [Leishmania major strain Friedlin]|eukprot:XP_001683371.1 conserved hypothetical protein [Leishmania major strain Friedlin]
MSSEPANRHRSQWSLTADPRMPSSAAALTQSSYLHALGATQQLQSESQHLPKARNTVASGASINPAMATVAQQKARYARGPYVPPPALRRSRLHLGPTADTSGVLGGTQHIYEGRRALTQPATWSLPLQSASAQRRTPAGAGPTTRAAVNGDTTLHPLPPPPPSLHPVPSPPTEWCQALVALQERQLLCWQQLIETQQLMTHHVGRLQEELQYVREVLKHGLGKHSTTEAVVASATDPRKRSRSEGHDHFEAAIVTKSAAAVPTASAATSQRNMTVHAVRLLGESTTSTPAVVQDAAACRGVAQPAEVAQRFSSRPSAERKEGSGGGSGAAHSKSTADAADSEADIFML